MEQRKGVSIRPKIRRLQQATPLQRVHQLLRRNIGAIRVMFHELGNVDLAPDRSTIFNEISEQWNLPSDEQEALRLLLSRAQRVSSRGVGRDIVEFGAFSHLLRGPLTQEAVIQDQLAEPSARRHFPIAFKNCVRNVERELKEHLQLHGGVQKTLSLSQYASAMKTFDAPLGDFDAAERFRIAAMKIPAPPPSYRVPVEQLAEVSDIPLVRTRRHSSVLVRNALLWDDPPDSSATPCPSGPPPMCAIPDSPRASNSRPRTARTTRAAELRKNSRETLWEQLNRSKAVFQLTSEWSPRNFRARMPRCPRPAQHL